MRVLRWVLWSRRRLAGVVVAGLVLLALVGSIHRHRSTVRPGASVPVAVREQTPTSRGDRSSTTTSGPGSTKGARIVDPAPTTVAGLPQPAIDTAAHFLQLWVQRAAQPQWSQQLASLATPQLAAGLATTDPANLPAAVVTGIVSASGDSGGGQIVVQTDTVKIVVTVTAAPGGWLVSDLQPLGS